MNTTSASLLHQPAAKNSRLGFALIFILILFLYSFCHLACAAPLVPIDGNTHKINLATSIDILDNPNNSISIDNLVNTDIINQFAPIELSSGGSLAEFSNHFWLRFSLANNTARTQTFWLQLNASTAKHISLYEIQTAGPVKYLPTNNAPVINGLHSPLLKEIVLPPHARSTYLMAVDTVRKQALRIDLLTPPQYMQETSTTNRLFSFGLGILSALVILLTFLALYKKSVVFLYYSCFVIACSLIEATALDFPRIWFPEFPSWYAATICILTCLSYSSLIKFTQHYLKAAKLQSRLWHYLNYAQYSNFCFTVAALFFINDNPYLALIPIIITAPLILAAMNECYSSCADKTALYININNLVCSLGFAFIVFNQTNMFSLDLFIQPHALFLIIIQTVITTLLLIDKDFRQVIDDERAQAQTNSNDIQYRAQTEIISRLSNEFRTPLSGILGMAELLKASSLTAEQHGKVDSIKNAGQSLLNSLSDMHYHAQLKQNSATIRKSPFELRLLLDMCIQTFQAKAEHNNIELILDIQNDVPFIVEGDELRLRQILIQLIDNAIKNTHQGEVVIKVSTLASNNESLHFSVRDTGPGINEQQLQKLYTSPTPDSRTSTEEHGLQITSDLLEQLKSQLNTDSREGEGSEFSFSLSLPSITPAQQGSKPLDSILKYKRLLIVDDNHSYCKVLKHQTSHWGMQVTVAHSGNEAIAMYRAKRNLGEIFDAIIIDYDMPKVSGIEVAEKISMEAAAPPVIILLAGLLQSPPEHITKQAGIDAMLNKPASENLLKLTLANQFHIRKRAATKPSANALPTMHILLAEDNDVMRSVISKMLDNLPMEYKMVSDGKLALDAAKKERFDVILMDCEMPFMNGFDATRQIHAWQYEKHQEPTPVIALTAYTLGEHKNKSFAAGMVDYLEKPINMTELEALLQKYRPS